jgi:hypothetical protein
MGATLRLIGCFTKLVCAIAAVVIAAATIPAVASAACQAAWTNVSPSSTGSNAMWMDVYSISRSNAWAVGSLQNSPETPQAEHWNGTAWKSTSIPLPSGGGSTGLNAVAGTSSSDVWAVGFHDLNGVTSGLAYHWTGTAWSRTPLPTAANVYLYDVSAADTGDAWAVGELIGSTGYSAGPVAYHWDGSSWTLASPTPPMNNSLPLIGVTDLGGGNAAAIAEYGAPLYEFASAMWTTILPPSNGDGLYADAMLASSESDVLLVGEDVHMPAGGSNTYGPLVEHWNGTSWTVLNNAVNPNSDPTQTATLSDIASDPSTGIWSVGFADGGNQYLAEEYDGSTWTLASPATTHLNSTLAAVSASHGAVMTIGSSAGVTTPRADELCPVQVTDAQMGGGTVNIGKAAVFVAAQGNSQAHTIEDGSGMGLFTSSPIPAGGMFSFSFPAAGSYPIQDPTSATTGTVTVPMSSSRSSGTTATTFTIRWATATAPSGFVYDVAIRRPGATAFKLWKTGTTAASASFKPDKGTGTYRFEARLRKLAGGSAGYSPALSIKVT